MKKVWNILIVLVLMGSLVPLALADDADDSSEKEFEINDETKEEVGIMVYEFGAQVRLLQLEKAITINIVKGEIIISYLESNTSTNTSELEAILEELKILKEEVASADPNASEAVQVFVDLKHDAINLSKEFRDTLHGLVDNETIESIREETRNMSNGSFAKLVWRIRFRIRLYNGFVLHKLYMFLGESNESLIEHYKDGNFTISQVKQKIGKTIKSTSKEKRYQVYSKIKEWRIRKKVQTQVCIANATQDFQQRQQGRLTNRLNTTVQGMNDGAVKQAIMKHLTEKINEGNAKSGGK